MPYTLILKRSIMIGILILLSGAGLRVVLGSDPENETSTGQIQFAIVSVNGRTLTGPNSGARRQNGQILIPVAAVAQAFGDNVSVDPASRRISVRRQNGVASEFDPSLGIVTENGATILTISNAGQQIYPPNTDDLYLPGEIFAALFDASVAYDSAKKEVVIRRGQGSTFASQTQLPRNVIDLHRLDFEYNLNSYSATIANSLALLGAGRIADGRFTFTSNASRTTQGVSIQNASFHLERPNGQRFTGGDFGTGGNLSFMAANVRGISTSVPIGNSILTAFGGRTFSGVIPFLDDDIFTPTRLSRYDTNTFGATVDTVLDHSLSVSGGGLRFNSPNRSGTMATGGLRYGSERVRIDGDLAYGTFRGLTEGVQSSGGAGAIDLAASYQILDNLSVQARYTKIGQDFLSPQSGVREPLDLKAASVTWSPSNWLSTAFSASTSRRPGSRTQNNDFATAALSITPGGNTPRLFISHTQGSTSQLRRSEFTTLNASKDFSRLKVYLNATRIKNLGAASVNANIGASFTVNDTNAIDVTQGFGNRRSSNGQIDWRGSNLFRNRLNLTAGAGYSYSPSSGFSPYQRLAAGLNLPRQTSVQLNYYNTGQGSALMISVRGSLFRKREAQAFLGSPVSEMNSYGKVSGRVYQDTNLNGQFDAGVDKPQADVKVRVDGNRYVVTDSSGLYTFDSVAAGEHKVYLDLLSVRADLTLLDDPAADTSLRAGHESTFDFRLVRTGRISGRVWVDANENAIFDAGEKPLADIRIATASGRDTLTDADGNFTIADLPPGEHIFFIDEKTLPEKMVSARKPLAVHAFAGRETSDLLLPVISTPAEIVRFPGRQN